MFGNIYKGKSVLITGDTGFKGSWLALWLVSLGAKVSGVSIDIPTRPSHYDSLNLKKFISHYEADINNLTAIKKIVRLVKPDIIFHLAAQALVSKSYEEPTQTFKTNTFGSINILECLREYNNVTSVVMITSDKVYENVEWEWGYREIDRLGGYDPYSASKSMAEIAIRAYLKTLFYNCKTRVATVRAGNVIGGGDWAKDRIIPDCVKAWSNNKKVSIRNPNSTRPWQHVLEPLSGYLLVGKSLLKSRKLHGESFNFGPSTSEHFSVNDLINSLSIKIKDLKFEFKKKVHLKEANLLQLNCDKAAHYLSWKPSLVFSETVDFTSEWYQEFYSGGSNKMFDFSLSQINKYHSIAKMRGLNWAK